MIEKLKTVTDKYIEVNKNNPEILKKYMTIKNILNQENVFLNISIDYAYAILKDLEIPENEIKNIYAQLISLENNN